MTDITESVAGYPPAIKVEPLDWRAAGFVAVHSARFPDHDPTAHRVVKFYDAERVDRPSLQMASDRMEIRPACQDAVPGAGYIQMTPLYAQARGAVWCHECFPEEA